ncbi:MAG: hypothetical protein ABSG90_02415 [Dehalococcoidia bacterium]
MRSGRRTAATVDGSTVEEKKAGFPWRGVGSGGVTRLGGSAAGKGLGLGGT